MLLHGFRRVALLSAAIVVVALCLTTPALGIQGSYRIKVKPAGIRLLVPDDYEVAYTVSSRKQAKRLLKSSSDLQAEGETVGHLLANPYFAALDVDGDRYPEETIAIAVNAKASVLPSPEEISGSFSGKAAETLTVSQTEIAGGPALRVEYMDEGTRANDSIVTYSAQLYVFVPPGLARVVVVNFSRDVFNPAVRGDAYDRTVSAVIESVEFLR